MEQPGYNNTAEQIARACFDDRRFPKKWQAAVGIASMQFVGTAAVLMSGVQFYQDTLFRTKFGYTMFLTVLSQFFYVLIIPLFILFIAKKDMRATLRLHKTIDAFQVLTLAAISAGIFLFAQIENTLFVEQISGILGPSAETELDMLSAQTLSQLLFELVILCGLPAICEEIFFRGFVLRAFERISPVKAVLLSSLAFAVMHGNLEQLVYTFLIGILLGTVTIVTDSLLAGTVMHFTLNALSCLLVYPPIHVYFERLSGNHSLFLAVTGSLFTAGAALLILFIFYTRKKNRRSFGAPFVSDMRYPRQMPRQRKGETVAYVLGWTGFVLVNVFSMAVTWGLLNVV
ncbi:MAG: CPBP family intramembrane metalloprotease [Clostridia bacterium]|nr:CPBP family intramembrane metalloprotease [Clostridia bacterium]